MKTILVIWALTACLLAGIGVEEEKIEYARSWSFADPMLLVLGLICAAAVIAGRWKLDWVLRFQLLTAIIFATSGMLNGELRNGTLLNCLRTAMGGAAMYCVTRNAVSNQSQLRRFSWYCLVTAGVIYALSVPKLVTTWSGSFTNLLTVFGTIDLNSFGFIFVILFCAVAPVWLSDKSATQFLIPGVIAMGALISLSRSAWTNLFIAAAVILLVPASKGSKGYMFRVAAVSIALLAAFYTLSKTVGALPEAQRFGEQKVAGYGEDIVQVRLLDLTLTPLIEWAHQPALTLMVGDATSIQHTFFANAIWMTGVLGLLSGLALYGSIARCALAGMRQNLSVENRKAAVCLLALVLVMFLDDSVTNHRFHTQCLSYLFYASAGAFAGSLRNTTGRTVQWFMVRKTISTPRPQALVALPETSAVQARPGCVAAR